MANGCFRHACVPIDLHVCLKAIPCTYSAATDVENKVGFTEIEMHDMPSQSESPSRDDIASILLEEPGPVDVVLKQPLPLQ